MPARASAVAALLALSAVSLLPSATADHVTYPIASPPPFGCGAGQDMFLMGADEDETRFHNAAVRGYAEGDWVPFRVHIRLPGLSGGGCDFTAFFDHANADGSALGFDMLRTTDLAFGDSAFEGCTGAISEPQLNSEPPNMLWVEWALETSGPVCTLRIDAHLTASSAAHAGASAFEGCSLRAHLAGPPGQRHRCVLLDESDPCEGPVNGPPNVQATSQSDPPRNIVTWDARSGAGNYYVYRADAGGSFDRLVITGLLSYADLDVTPGNVYEYQVTALFDQEETIACSTAMVTTIPEFPTPLAVALAAVGGLAGFAVLRRRR